MYPKDKANNQEAMQWTTHPISTYASLQYTVCTQIVPTGCVQGTQLTSEDVDSCGAGEAWTSADVYKLILVSL